jgi:hypothetical protein
MAARHSHFDFLLARAVVFRSVTCVTRVTSWRGPNGTSLWSQWCQRVCVLSVVWEGDHPTWRTLPAPFPERDAVITTHHHQPSRAERKPKTKTRRLAQHR